MKELNKTIIFAHPKGGSGKSSSCMNTTIEFLYSGYDPIVYDQDNQEQMTKFNNSRKEYGLQVFKQFFSKNFEDIKSFLSEKRGLKIVDTGGYDSDIARLSYLVADVLIIPLNGSDNELDGLLDFRERLIEVLKLNPSLKIRLLINRVHHNNTETRKFYNELLENWDNFEVFNTVVPANKAYENMLFSGEAIKDKKLENKNPYNAIKAYTEEIKEILNG